MKKNRTASAIAAMITVGATFAAPAAAGAITVGPGSPIRMPEPGAVVDGGRHVQTGMCSTSVPGTVTDADGTRHRVLITAGHCVNKEGHEQLPKSSGVIYAPTHDGDVRIGEVGPAAFPIPDPNDAGANQNVLDSSFNGSDYAFIELDDDIDATSISYSVDENGAAGGEGVQMTGVVDYRELRPGEVAVDNFGQPICSDGARTGRNCGVQVFRVRNGVWAVSNLGKGDSGGNAYDPRTNEVIGINSMAVGPVSRYQPADQALQDAYGIEDGKVNEHFQVEESTAPHSDFRTIGQDMAADEAWAAENQPAEQAPGSSIPQIPGLPEIPLPEVPMPELPLPSLQLQAQ
ncbi:hypothetical protein ACFWGD_09875 [Corynebacterium sp. NPDC060344]|uniref:hypothetical protein n=1 Tax=Corynebacterium sp. NPDC060344 TaxID=3347101 RepID=UPI0036607C03